MKAKGASKESDAKAKKATTTGTMKAAPPRSKAATTGTQRATTTATRKAVTTTATRKAATTTATRRAAAPAPSPAPKKTATKASAPSAKKAASPSAALPSLAGATMVDASLPGFAAEKASAVAAAPTPIASAASAMPAASKRASRPKPAVKPTLPPPNEAAAIPLESSLTTNEPAAAAAPPARESGAGTATADDARLAGGHDVVTMASSSGRLKTFVKAVRDAGLVATLGGPGPFTVFAPSDRAFAKLAPRDLEALLADRNRLAAVLRRHVVEGLVRVRAGSTRGATSLDGNTLTITSENEAFQVNGARVVQMNVRASNGVIHVIDRVLMPR